MIRKFKLILFICSSILLSCSSQNSADTSNYPLHKNIKVTWFYVGEKENKKNKYIPKVTSAWDNIWLWHYGGVDDPYNRSDYYPKKFIPNENPFYFALPFNDLDENGNLKEIAKKIPWYSDKLFKKNGSVLKNKWIKIIKGNKVAYAQWEDVGPFGKDDFDYVFGNAFPSNGINEIALSVSPAVKDYLNLSDVDYVDWQFVEEDEVPDGPWKRIITKTPVTFISFKKVDLNTTWYYQLTGDLKIVPAKLYDIDLFETSKEKIENLKKQGKIVICYFSAGTYENWREDAYKFNKEDIGNPLPDWEGEYYLNINSENVRKIMLDRLDLAKEKGCDGVEPDNVNIYLFNTGFNITYQNQFNYNRFLTIEAKKRGLLVGLKNDIYQIKDLVDYFDFEVNEECHQYNECDYLMPFIKEGKPVFNVEYSKIYIENKTAFNKLCQDALKRNFQTIVLSKDLDGSIIKACGY